MYYANQLASARKEKRIGFVPYTMGVPVDTFWDIGLKRRNQHLVPPKGGLRLLLHPLLRQQWRGHRHYVVEMQRMGYVWGRHYLPHDGNTRRIQINGTKSYADLLAELGVQNTTLWSASTP